MTVIQVYPLVHVLLFCISPLSMVVNVNMNFKIDLNRVLISESHIYPCLLSLADMVV